MLNFEVCGMTRGHSEEAVTRAVKSVDPAAKVTVERAVGRVSVECATDAQAVKQAIKHEGYTVQATQA